MGTRIQAHRLVWWWEYGKLPNDMLDHINGNPLDNRIENLRDVNNKTNCRNHKRHRDGEFVGVSFRKDKYAYSKPWKAYSHINNKLIHISTYACKFQAAMAVVMFESGEIINGKRITDYRTTNE